jgi:hypothetical protein
LYYRFDLVTQAFSAFKHSPIIAEAYDFCRHGTDTTYGDEDKKRQGLLLTLPFNEEKSLSLMVDLY